MPSVNGVVLSLWIAVTGPGGQPIELNTDQIVSVRPPRDAEHFAPDVRCLIHTTDGKYITTIEPCDTIRLLLEVPD